MAASCALRAAQANLDVSDVDRVTVISKMARNFGVQRALACNHSAQIKYSLILDHNFGKGDKTKKDLVERERVHYAKRTQALSNLPSYQPELVRAVIREIRELTNDAAGILQSLGGAFTSSADPAATCSYLIDKLCMWRNKQCLLAYHRVRADKLEEMCWNGQDVLSQSTMQSNAPSTSLASDSSNISSLSPEEEEYVRQYGELLAAYNGQWTDIDLTGNLTPPKDLFIDVRVLEDVGEIQTEYGYDHHYFDVSY
ncbi:DNA replication protein psf1 [Agyrium rufum]|nr:DNA replication protein psf1 [Agyrium rufum]